MYVLLTGSPPFGGDSDADILEEIKAGNLEFDEEDWGEISAEAKDMVQKMMTFDKTTRPTAE
jgi:calcium-dependent protein kinase